MIKLSCSAHFKTLSLLFVVTALSACMTTPEHQQHSITGNEKAVAVLDVSSLIQHQWEELQIKGRTEYRVASSGGKPVLWASGRESASGLSRYIEFDANQCPIIEWSWRVDQLQADANLNVRSAEDVAASIYLLFGDPGLLSDPKLVPSLRYVWSNEKVTINEVVKSPYLPQYVHSIVVQAGSKYLGQWVTESRNIAEDYQLAFGTEPPDKIHAVVLFTDNDQTRQAVEAGYAWIKVTCP
jgi:hypothetical protein